MVNHNLVEKVISDPNPYIEDYHVRPIVFRFNTYTEGLQSIILKQDILVLTRVENSIDDMLKFVYQATNVLGATGYYKTDPPCNGVNLKFLQYCFDLGKVSLRPTFEELKDDGLTRLLNESFREIPLIFRINVYSVITREVLEAQRKIDVGR